MQLFSSWTGSDFLLFYTALLGLSTLAAWWMPAYLREAGRGGESRDAEDLALLAGGRARHADSVIADLYARGGLADMADGKLRVAEPSLLASPAGRALLSAREPIGRREADHLLAVHAARVTARLQREGLLLRPEAMTRLRWLSITPFATLFMIGLYRQRAGSALGEPTGLLVVLLGLTVVLALIRFAKIDQRTVAGIEAVEHSRAKASRLQRAPQPGEAALAVALFGTGVLVGSPWEPVHAMRQQGKNGDGGGSDSGSSDSDGGSGCGGGGCGGCGG
jgi:uncharacterized protein (TIGR04222 family)